MKSGTPFILVICGPPCSGKSSLRQALVKSRDDIRWHEMDDVRLRVLPGPINDEPARSAAYRIIHFRAGKDLLNGHSVLLATYQPLQHRSEVANLALRLDVPLFVVQCVCTPNEAVRRFAQRGANHGGADLTALRVKDLSERYERFDGALLLETTTNRKSSKFR
jgi:predicted kinase